MESLRLAGEYTGTVAPGIFRITVVGSISSGIGTIAVIFYGEASLGTQLTGIIGYGIFTFVASLIVWFILKAVMGIRVTEEDEINGLDMAELGMEAYPEFSKG